MYGTHHLPAAVEYRPWWRRYDDLLRFELLVLTIIKTKVEIVYLLLLVFVAAAALGGIVA